MCIINTRNAAVMELADVTDSKSVGSDTVPVQVRPAAPRRSKLCIACSDLFYKSERAHDGSGHYQLFAGPPAADVSMNHRGLNCFPDETESQAIAF